MSWRLGFLALAALAVGAPIAAPPIDSTGGEGVTLEPAGPPLLTAESEPTLGALSAEHTPALPQPRPRPARAHPSPVVRQVQGDSPSDDSGASKLGIITPIVIAAVIAIAVAYFVRLRPSGRANPSSSGDASRTGATAPLRRPA